MDETEATERHSKESLAPLHARRAVGGRFAAVILALFYGLVLAMAFAPRWIGAGAPFSIGLAITVLVMLAAIGLNWLYIRRTRNDV